MKLLFSLTYYSPYVSGLTLYVKRLSEALLKEGYQCSVVSFQYDKNLKQEENINGVWVVRVKPLVKISKGFISLDWIIRCFQEVKKTDVVFVNLPQLEGIIPAICAKLLRKKLITIYHCEVHLPNGIMNRIIEWILHISHFKTLFLSDQVITYTQDFAKHSVLLPHFTRKLKYIYPPIPVPKVDKRIQNIFRKKIWGKDPIIRGGHAENYIIGVAARLAAEKGIEYLLEAIPLLKDKLKYQRSKIKNNLNLQPATYNLQPIIKFVIAGSLNPVGESAYKEKIMKLVEKYKENIIFLGEAKEEDMGSFYSLLDVLVLPSVNSTEAFGMVQVEAMMMGVPVVATDLPGVRVPIQKTRMGKIIPIRNCEKLGKAIAEVMMHKKKYQKTFKTISDEFDIKRTISFYKKLIS